MLSSPQAHILQSTLLAEVFQDFSFRPFLAIAERKGEIIGGLMSFIWSADYKIPMATFFSRLRSYYGPILLSSDKKIDILRQILLYVNSMAKKRRVIDHEISVPYMGVHDQLKTLGYAQMQHCLRYTFIVNLSKSREELRGSLEKRCKYSIRKAENAGVEIVEGAKNDAPQIFHRLHVHTAKRLGIHPNPYSFTRAIWNILVPRKHARFFFAYYKDNPIAGAIILYFKDKMYYYMSTSLKEYWEVCPNNALQWYVILNGKSHGYQFYDLMGCPGEEEKDHPEYGLYRFKKSFGGEMKRIGATYQKVFSPFTLKLWNSFLIPTYKRLSFISSYI